MIGGFMVQGTESKRVIIRAIGPELTQYGVPDALANPTLELHDGTGALIASNNNWATTIIGGIITANQVRDIQNSGHAPGDHLDSAIIADLPAGSYTAIVRGVNSCVRVSRDERRRSDFRCAAIRSPLVWRPGRNHECDQIRKIYKRDSQHTLICVCDAYGNVIQTHHPGVSHEAAGVCHEQPLGKSTITREVGTLDKNASGRDTKRSNRRNSPCGFSSGLHAVRN